MIFLFLIAFNSVFVERTNLQQIPVFQIWFILTAEWVGVFVMLFIIIHLLLLLLYKEEIGLKQILIGCCNT